MSSEESNKMSKKTPSQDSNSEEIKWELDDMKKAYEDFPYTNDWDDFAGG